jgi:tetratricopeptide (TPR) repeat protein
MFTSRNIHFAILGIILGATFGYIFAFYQVQSTMPPPALGFSGTPPNHPEVSNEQLLAMFKEALAKNPNNPELMTKYANFLFDLQKYSEAAEWFQKVLAIQPDNIGARTDMATALWNIGQRDKAMAEYQKSLAADPRHMPTLYNVVIAELDGSRNLQAASDVVKKMEAIDPNYPGLAALKKRLEQESAKAGK